MKMNRSISLMPTDQTYINKEEIILLRSSSSSLQQVGCTHTRDISVIHDNLPGMGCIPFWIGAKGTFGGTEYFIR